MLSGRCACKAVAYEVSDEFVAAYNCHCSNCRAYTSLALAIGSRSISTTNAETACLIESSNTGAITALVPEKHLDLRRPGIRFRSHPVEKHEGLGKRVRASSSPSPTTA